MLFVHRSPVDTTSGRYAIAKSLAGSLRALGLNKILRSMGRILHAKFFISGQLNIPIRTEL
jgi:hypothetical protein